MAQYWETRPRPSAADKSKTASVPPSLVKCGPLLKDFHRHRERLTQQDKTREAEDWQSELRVYLKVVAKDVSPETDVVMWWQVRGSYTIIIKVVSQRLRTMRQNIRPLLASHLTTYRPRHLQSHVNVFFPQPNKPLLTGAHVSVLKNLNSFKFLSLPGVEISPILQR